MGWCVDCGWYGCVLFLKMNIFGIGCYIVLFLKIRIYCIIGMKVLCNEYATSVQLYEIFHATLVQ